MIEKLKYEYEIQEKINEIIDELNHILEEREHVIKVYEEVMPNMKPVDPYAEQRKWIGKACWFWDNNAQTKAFGWLEKIDTEEKEAPFLTNFGQWYDNCKPVKWIDDIIYKGE